MMVPKQLANTIEFILELLTPAIGAVVAIVIGPPLGSRVPPRKTRQTGALAKMNAGHRPGQCPGPRDNPVSNTAEGLETFGRRIGPSGLKSSLIERPAS